MNEVNKAAQLCARIGLILLLISAGLSMLVRVFPEPFMAFIGLDAVSRGLLLNPLLYLPEIISFAIFILLYYLLKCDFAGKSHLAGVLLILVLVYIGAMPVFSAVLSSITRNVAIHLTSAAEYGTYSMVRAVIGYIGIIGTLSRPLLAVAAALNWADSKQRSA